MPQTTQKPLVEHNVSDRYPLHFGAKATVAAVTSVLRLAEYGYRLQYIDLLSELIEGDPHARSVLQIRASAVASRPWSIAPAATETESEARKAKIVADYVAKVIKKIPKWKCHVKGLLNGIVTGVGAREIMWVRRNGEFIPKNLRFMHNRRLAYDTAWRLCWTAYGYPQEGTNQSFPLEDYPGKFLSFEPTLSDEYPTREGLGRTLAYWLSFKRFSIRDLLQFVERFGKPSVDVSYKSGSTEADETAIVIAKQIVQKFGAGSLSGGVHPDTVDVKLIGNGSGTNASSNSGENTPHKAIANIVDEGVSKLVLGQAYTTNSSQGKGLGQSGDSFENAQKLIIADDASQVSEAIDTGLIYWIVKLNFGDEAVERYLPHYQIDVEDPEDDKVAVEKCEKLVKIGFPLPVQYVADRFKLPLPKDGELVLSGTGKAVLFGDDDEDDEPPEPPENKPGEKDPDEEPESSDEDDEDDEGDPDAGEDEDDEE